MPDWINTLINSPWFYAALTGLVVAFVGYKNAAPILEWLKKIFPNLGGGGNVKRMQAFYEVRCQLEDCDCCPETMQVFDEKIAPFAFRRD